MKASYFTVQRFETKPDAFSDANLERSEKFSTGGMAMTLTGISQEFFQAHKTLALSSVERKRGRAAQIEGLRWVLSHKLRDHGVVGAVAS